MAFVFVFLHHSLPAKLPLPLLTALGFGNDMFFLLTGYLVTALLWNERESKARIDIKGFYVRRVLRIWPLYFLCIVIVTALDDWEPAALQLRSFHILGMFLFTGNWAMIYAPVSALATPLWSISVSEQFYLVWPWLLQRARVKTMLFLCAAAMIAAFLYRWWMFRIDATWPALHFATIARFDPFAVGAAIALWYRGRTPYLSVHRRIGLGLISGAAAGFLIYAVETSLLRPHKTGAWYPLSIVALGGILLSVLGSMSQDAPRWLLVRVMSRLGKLSFGMFLWHGIVVALAQHAGVPRLCDRLLGQLHHHEFWMNLAFLVITFSLTIAVASVSYQMIEKPFLGLKRRQIATEPQNSIHDVLRSGWGFKRLLAAFK